MVAAGAFVYGLYMILRTVIFGNPVPGYPSLIVVVLFLGGIQLISLGVIGEYLARTYSESKGRTLYFVKGFHPSALQQSRSESIVDRLASSNNDLSSSV